MLFVGLPTVQNKKIRLLLNFNVAFLEYEIRAHHSLPYILYIFYNSFKMRSSIVRASNEDIVRLSRTRGCIYR
jgi:hypothetical protein